MRSRWALLVVRIVLLVALAGPAQRAGFAQALEPITYTIKFAEPGQHVAEVEAVYPTEGRAAIDLMMPIWTPGFYRVENYPGKVLHLSAHTPVGQALHVGQPNKNRWSIASSGAKEVLVSYKLKCDSRRPLRITSPCRPVTRSRRAMWKSESPVPHRLRTGRRRT